MIHPIVLKDWDFPHSSDTAGTGNDALFAGAAGLHEARGRRRTAPGLKSQAKATAVDAVNPAAEGAHAPVRASGKVLGAELHKRMNCAQALRSVVRLGTQVVLANARGALADDDPEFVHQARVALRRVRSAVRVLRGHAPFPAALAGELRWLARSLGAARDWDVLAAQTLPRLLSDAGVTNPAAGDLLRAAQQRRQSARERALRTLAGPRFPALASSALRWAEAGAEGPPLQQVAAQLVASAARRLRRAARGFATQSAGQQHRVRILAKRLRYTLDLLAPCLPKERMRRFSGVLAKLQDELGGLNDAAVAQAALSAMKVPDDVWAALHTACAVRSHEHLRRAERLLRKLDEMPLPGE